MNENSLSKTCPYCGAQLPEGAAFCPRCARSVNRRREAAPPRNIPRRALYGGLLAAAALALALALALGLWLRSRPQVYDNGTAEVLYTRGGETWQVLAGWMDDRVHPANQIYQPVEDGDMLYTFPQCLYINYPGSGADAKDEFMEKVERVTAAFDMTENPDLPWYCDEPAPRKDYVPEAALVSPIHFHAGSGRGTILWTVEMKNGDVIRLHQTMEVKLLERLLFTPEDTPLDTVEEVQALLDSLEERTGGEELTVVEIHLPPVTYEGGITIPRDVNLYGAGEETGGRTVFTGPVRVTNHGSTLSWIYDLDLAGGGDGVGFSSSSRAFLQGCRISDWRTGILVQNRWVCAFDCVFEDNEIGLHLNSDLGEPMDDRCMGDVFRNNGTAVLLERVAGLEVLSFPETVFSGNTTDIDNRCGQELDVSEAVFE